MALYFKLKIIFDYVIPAIILIGFALFWITVFKINNK